jgi:hypothetical protein
MSISLTLPTLLKSLSFPSSYIYLPGLVLLVLSAIYIFKIKTSIVYKMALFLLCFNSFTYHAFFNSYYLVTQFLLFDIAIDYFGLKIL